ncbi:HesA/MoeB/ThiF family protein [Brevundimonas sp. VNH65]|uniref:HesA/MoeB/ThiF family protein n=1 Tax=Brevundimonas sp. VNH65 TaxID=3400917 RepID=UPI003BFB8F9D
MPQTPAPFSDAEVERYARHLVLSEIGGPGQQRLAAARVLIVGAGGVGGPAALYLAAAGVGTIGLVDDDTVALSNLQRQILFSDADIGAPKVQAAAARLARTNPHVSVEGHGLRLTPDNAAALIAAHDLVIDGTDDFSTRFAVNAACVAGGKPLVSAALGRWTGQVAVFQGRPCYQCLVPEAPPDAETCARVGVVGALTGVIGAMAALEAIKLITGAGEPLTGRLMLYDGLAGTSRTVRVAADPTCGACSDQAKARDSRAT